MVVGVAEVAEEAAGGVAAAVAASGGVTMPITRHLVNVDPDLIDPEAGGLHVAVTILVIVVMIGDMLRIRLVLSIYDGIRIVVS